MYSFVNPFPQRFPDDGLGTVVRNVFDFDGYSKEVGISNCKYALCNDILSRCEIP